MPEHSFTPYRKLELENLVDPVPGLVDVTIQLGSSEVTLVEQYDAISELSFTLRHGAAYWIDVIEEGMRCKLTAGYAVDIPLRTTKKVFFEGIVTSFTPLFPDNGKPELRVTCHDDLYELTRSTPGRVTYPGTKVPNQPNAYVKDRTFHFVESGKITISQIVKGILDEHALPIKQIAIDAESDYEFTTTNPISQGEDESDYSFIQRLLTGKSSKTRERVRKKKTNHLVNARARMWMETDPITKIPKVHVVSEDRLLDDVGDVTFVYQAVGVQSVDESSYDPLSPDASLVIRNVQLRENKDQATGRDVTHRQDVSPGAKGQRTKADPKQRGKQRSDVKAPNNGKTPPPDWDKNYVLNRELILRDRSAGVLKVGDLFQAIKSGQVGWSQVKRYFIPKLVAHAPSARTIPNSAAPPTKVQAKTPTGFGGGGKEQTQKKRIKKYGRTLSFSAHGNLFVACRKSYPVGLGTGRYDGFWFATKVRHTWGLTYKISVEMGR